MERISLEEAREITQRVKTEYDKKIGQRVRDEILYLTNSIIEGAECGDYETTHGILFKDRDNIPINKDCMKSIVSYFRDQGYKVNWGKNTSNDRYWIRISWYKSPKITWYQWLILIGIPAMLIYGFIKLLSYGI